MSVASWCSTCCFCVVRCVGFCTGHFDMVPLNLTYLHCLQHSQFEHHFNLYLLYIQFISNLVISSKRSMLRNKKQTEVNKIVLILTKIPHLSKIFGLEQSLDSTKTMTCLFVMSAVWFSASFVPGWQSRLSYSSCYS